MTVFGIGTLELILVLLLLILIFGPERITEMAKWLGQSYRKLTGATNEINQQVMQVKKAMTTAVDMPDLTNPIQEVAQEVTQEIANVQSKVDGIQKEIKTEMNAPSIAPPTESPEDKEKPKA